MNFIEELKWRGMIHDMMPGTEEMLKEGLSAAYVGIDPTADSLHIGHLVGVMMLKHFQISGHKPIALVGGATGMIGDPSGKSQERNLLDLETLRHNEECLKIQLSKFLDFSGNKPNSAELVNNYDWMSKISFLDFIRDIGKNITVNYMIAKDSVKKRLTNVDDKSAEGMSFTEFSYQLVQGYDFLHLYNEKNCKLQMGGSDQWGNITTGTELIRRKVGGKAFALTCPLITKADGGKFGKTEKGNIWLDANKTSPYQFYQFWINTSDADAEKYIKIFTIFSQEEIDKLISEHHDAPHLRILQSALAKYLTITVHNEHDYNAAIEASQILFGKGTKESFEKLDFITIKDIFEGVPTYNIDIELLKSGINILDLLVEKTQIFKSKSELKRLMKENGLSINQEKESNEEKIIDLNSLVQNKCILVKQGKKNYFLILVDDNKNK